MLTASCDLRRPLLHDRAKIASGAIGLFECRLERAPVERKQLDVVHGADRGRSARLREKADLAEELARTERRERHILALRAPAGDRHLSAGDDVETVGFVALLENRLSGGNRDF